MNYAATLCGSTTALYGQPLASDRIATIEAKALVQRGMDPAAAKVTVQKAIDTLKASGISGPTGILWR